MDTLVHQHGEFVRVVDSGRSLSDLVASATGMKYHDAANRLATPARAKCVEMSVKKFDERLGYCVRVQSASIQAAASRAVVVKSRRRSFRIVIGRPIAMSVLQKHGVDTKASSL